MAAGCESVATSILRSHSSQDSIERNPDRSQDSSFDLFHEPSRELAPQSLLAQKLLGKGCDLLAFQYAVLRDAALSPFQSYVSRSVAANCARRDDENVASQSVASIDRNDQGGPLLSSALAGDRHPLQTPAKRRRIQFQVFPICCALRSDHSRSSVSSSACRSA